MADILLRQGQVSPTDILLYPETSISIVAVSGGIVTSGAALFSVTKNPLPSGGIITSGAASFAPSYVYSKTGSGTVITSGNANPKYIATEAVSGGIVTSGSAFPKEISTPAIGGLTIASNSAAPKGIYLPAVSGGAVLSGSANAAKVTAPVISGGAVTSGAAGDYLISKPAVSGGVVASGVADGTYYPAGGGAPVEYLRTGSGLVTLSGSAAYLLEQAGGINAGHGGPVRFANSYKGPQPKAKSLDNTNKVADVLRVVPEYKAPPIPPTITRVDVDGVYVAFSGTTSPSKSTKQAPSAVIISLFGEAMPTRSLNPRNARKNGFSGSAQVSFTADFNDDDIEQIATWLLRAS